MSGKNARLVYDPTEDRKKRKELKLKPRRTPNPKKREVAANTQDPAIEKPAEEKPKEKLKAEVKEKPAGVTYPVKLFCNEYGFIRIKNKLREDLGWGRTKTKDKAGIKTDLVAEKDEEGRLIICRA